MRVIITKDKKEMGKVGALIVARQIRRQPNSVIGFATGSTPLPLYEELIRMHREEKLCFSKMISFNLDEYVGLAPDHPQSYNYFMWENLFKHIDAKPQNVHIPQGIVEDYEDHCLWYEERIEECGGIDIQILGIGSDGHIAFNEPGSSLGSRTRVVSLYPQTREDNARFFDKPEEVPHLAVSMGVGTILDAGTLILLANGKGKAEAVAAAIEGPVTSQITASALQLHPDPIFIVDEEAASKLKHIDFYKDSMAMGEKLEQHELKFQY